MFNNVVILINYRLPVCKYG